MPPQRARKFQEGEAKCVAVTEDHDEKEEMVSLSNTSSDPRAMMILPAYAFIAYFAVTSTVRKNEITCFAVEMGSIAIKRAVV